MRKCILRGNGKWGGSGVSKGVVGTTRYLNSMALGW